MPSEGGVGDDIAGAELDVTDIERRRIGFIHPWEAGPEGGAFKVLRNGYERCCLTTTWRRLFARAGVEGLQFRDLRRTAATQAATLEDARDLLGHTSTAITRRVHRTWNRVRPTG